VLERQDSCSNWRCPTEGTRAQATAEQQGTRTVERDPAMAAWAAVM
jgi:hypothetical protein